MLVVARSTIPKYCSWGHHGTPRVGDYRRCFRGSTRARRANGSHPFGSQDVACDFPHAGAGRCQLRPGVKRTDTFCCALPPLLTFFSRSSKLSIGELVRRMIAYTTKDGCRVHGSRTRAHGACTSAQATRTSANAACPLNADAPAPVPRGGGRPPGSVRGQAAGGAGQVRYQRGCARTAAGSLRAVGQARPA
jgi:hypothetical protein